VSNASMPTRVSKPRRSVEFTFDDTVVVANEGDTVAAALIADGVRITRTTPVSDSPRAPYCMMGVCFDCLVMIDGVANQQACMVTAADGMRVSPMSGARAYDNEESDRDGS